MPCYFDIYPQTDNIDKNIYNSLRVYNSQRRKALNAKQVSQMLQKLISKAERAKDQEDFTSGKMPIQESIFDRTSTHIAPIRERFNILNEHMMKNLNK